MAVITLALTLTAQTQQFKTAPGNVLLDTLRPIGLQWFHGIATLVAKIATNETIVRLTCNFPAQYVYCLKSLDVVIRLTLGTTHNFQADGLAELSQPAVGRTPDAAILYYPLHNKGIAYESNAGVIDPSRAFVLDGKVPLIIPGGGTFRLTFADVDAGATNAGFVNAVVCFYQYEREQGLSSDLNTAPPVLLIN